MTADYYLEVSEQSIDLLLQVDVLTKKHFGKKFFCQASNGAVVAAAAWANVTVEMRRKLAGGHAQTNGFFRLVAGTAATYCPSQFFCRKNPFV